MVENKKTQVEYKKIEDLKLYIQRMIDNGAQIIVGEKTARIAARPGVPGIERIITWSADADGNPVLEKDAIVSVDESGTPGVYTPVGGPQRFIRLNEGIHIVQWGEEWHIDAGGYINITDPEDMCVISGRDFRDTYRLVDTSKEL